MNRMACGMVAGALLCAAAGARAEPPPRWRECTDCPWLVTLQPGRYLMGSPADEPGRLPNEGPQHLVTIAYRLAVTETPITRGQFRAYVQATGRRPIRGCNVWSRDDWRVDPTRHWESPGFVQTDNHPAVCISWHDAQGYAGWLSLKTGHRYRLLSEAEWEYAARAGSRGRYFFGDDERALCRYANVPDRAASTVLGDVQTDCDDGFAYTSPVHSFTPNPWGLHDVHGNVWQWVEDCFSEGGYASTPIDGSSMRKVPCRERVLRGGGWNNRPSLQRSAYRDHARASGRHANAGLRLARTLP